MTIVVDVVDDTGLVAGHDAVRALVEAVLEAEGVSGEVAVAFVDEPSIAGLNSRYREAEGSTDVLAFDYPAEPEWPGPAEGEAASGEIVVCPQVVMRYAAEEGREATCIWPATTTRPIRARCANGSNNFSGDWASGCGLLR